MECLQKKLADEEQTRNTEARLNRTKPLDELEEQKATLECQIKENKSLIEDENTSSSEREAVEARNEEGEKELAGLNQQIQEREKARHWREKIKEIFTKHGFTITAVVTAVGLTIGVIVDKLTTGVSSVTKAIGNGVKDLSKKDRLHSPRPAGSDRELCVSHGRSGYLISWQKRLASYPFCWRRS